MKKLLSVVFTLSSLSLIYSQTVELPETVITVNSDYMNSVEYENNCSYVNKLEKALLEYKSSQLSELYDTKNDIYNVTFQIPEGQIVASFNKDGKIIKTFEKYNNIRLPHIVLQAIAEKYPQSSIVEDVYVVKFHCDEDALEQVYKIKIKNNDSIITVKTNKKGEFI